MSTLSLCVNAKKENLRRSRSILFLPDFAWPAPCRSGTIHPQIFDMTKTPRAPPRARQPTSDPIANNRAKRLPPQALTHCWHEVAVDISYGTECMRRRWGGSCRGIRWGMATVRACTNLSARGRLPNMIHLGSGVGPGKGVAVERNITGLPSVAAGAKSYRAKPYPVAFRNAGLQKMTPAGATHTRT